MQRRAYYQEQEQYREKIINSVIDDFEKAGWENWEPSDHYGDEQFKRIERSLKERFSLCWYNPTAGIAKISSSSGNYYLVGRLKCSCPDYKDRRLPCKHMYFLARVLDDYENHLVPEHISNNYVEDTALRGLQFSISGRGQTPIKGYIVKHYGSFDRYSWKYTSSVVRADDNLTQTVTRAFEDGVWVFSFDNLKLLVDGRKYKTPTAD